MTNRKELLHFAESFAGASATNARREEYLNLLTRGVESKRMRQDMGGMSSCSLFVRAVLWFMGESHPLYQNPYRIGYASADVVTVARSHGAYIPGNKLSPEKIPQPGDIFITNTGHFGFIVRRLPCPDPGVWQYETVDGGQGPKGASIQRRLRKFVKGGKYLHAWVDVDKLDLPGLRKETEEIIFPHKAPATEVIAAQDTAEPHEPFGKKRKKQKEQEPDADDNPYVT